MGNGLSEKSNVVEKDRLGTIAKIEMWSIIERSRGFLIEIAIVTLLQIEATEVYRLIKLRA